VEGELGCLGSLEHGMGEKEDGHGAEGKLTMDQLLTDPDQAVDFVNRTGIDALAVAMGTSHGAYKFSKKPTGDVLAIKRIEEIHAKIPNCHLVMHGSSSVPKNLIDEINKYGGKMKETYGVPVEEIQRGIRSGVRKINVDTDNRLAITAAIRKVFVETPDKFDPRDYLTPARAAMQKICAERMTQFGQAGGRARCRRSAWRRWPSTTPPASSARTPSPTPPGASRRARAARPRPRATEPTALVDGRRSGGWIRRCA
jgi:fructose-bisphosphate aldolase class II